MRRLWDAMGVAFAVAVVAGWFVMAIWMAVSIAQIAADQTTCVVTASAEAGWTCSP